jgi:DNA modification methylase
MRETNITCLTQEHHEKWSLYRGDTFEVVKGIPENSIGLSVFSPPFPGMYTYSNSARDMGNTKNIEENITQFKYLMPEMLRITKPGRSCAIHLCQSVAFKNQDGYIGIKDFRGRVIQAMENNGWIYYGEVCIDKCPQLKAIRTKDQGLLFKSLATDSSRMHMALADYLLQFRKPGDNTEPIKAGISEKYKSLDGWITAEEWIEWAAPVWYRKTPNYPGGIKETDVLQYRHAKDAKDEKHLCPLQLGVIERAVKLWSNPGDIVYSPFAGIGSEGWVALKLKRLFVGCELKESYYDVAVNNLKSISNGKQQMSLFDL